MRKRDDGLAIGKGGCRQATKRGDKVDHRAGLAGGVRAEDHSGLFSNVVLHEEVGVFLAQSAQFVRPTVKNAGADAEFLGNFRDGFTQADQSHGLVHLDPLTSH